MRNGRILTIVAAIGLLVAVETHAGLRAPANNGQPSQDGEVAIKRSELPPAVEKTVSAESANASVKGFTREVENGQTFYEVELVVAGHSRDVLIDPEGNVVEVEEQVAFNALPAKVKTALRTRAGKGRIRTVESLTKGGKLVAYEAHVLRAGKWSEIQVGPSGETLALEE